MISVVRFGAPPITWKRAGGNGRQRYTTPEYRKFQFDFRWEARAQHEGAPWNEECGLSAVFAPDGIVAVFDTNGASTNVFPWYGYQRPAGLTGDIDNYVKAVMDSAQGVVIENDKLVCTVVASFATSILDAWSTHYDE